MEIFISNLDAGIQEELLTILFEAFGTVTTTVLVRDKETRMSKGFGFVTMENAIDGQRAIDDLNGRELAGKILRVKKSVPKEEREVRNAEKYISNRSQRTNERPKFFSEDSDEEEYREIDGGVSDEVIDAANYTKNISDDGLVKISFKK